MIDCLIITSTSLRHKFFALNILKYINNSVVIFEKRDRINYYKVENKGLMKAHFDNLFKTEKKYFNKFIKENTSFLKSRTKFIIDKNDINSERVVNKIQEINPKCIVLYSVSIIKDKLINLYQRRLFNVHAGLSPFYRGTATNIWPIIEGKPEYIGMTIHHIDKGIDSGGLILQGRPLLVSNDNSHTMACKNTVLVSKLMIKVVEEFNKNSVVPNKKQILSKGKQYFFNDFNVQTVEKLNNLLYQNIIDDYINNPKKVDIIEW